MTSGNCPLNTPIATWTIKQSLTQKHWNSHFLGSPNKSWPQRLENYRNTQSSKACEFKYGLVVNDKQLQHFLILVHEKTNACLVFAIGKNYNWQSLTQHSIATGTIKQSLHNTLEPAPPWKVNHILNPKAGQKPEHTIAKGLPIQLWSGGEWQTTSAFSSFLLNKTNVCLPVAITQLTIGNRQPNTPIDTGTIKQSLTQNHWNWHVPESPNKSWTQRLNQCRNTQSPKACKFKYSLVVYDTNSAISSLLLKKNERVSGRCDNPNNTIGNRPLNSPIATGTIKQSITQKHWISDFPESPHKSWTWRLENTRTHTQSQKVRQFKYGLVVKWKTIQHLFLL